MTLAFLYCIGWWLFVGHMDRLRVKEDPIYAAQFFDGILPVEDVLASRKWHSHEAESWDCTYAIARLSPNRPEVPPSRPRINDLGWQYQFGGNWIQTPMPLLSDNMRDAISFCEKYWPQTLSDEIRGILGSFDAWYIRDPIGETIFLYAPQQRLALRVRFGD